MERRKRARLPSALALALLTFSMARSAAAKALTGVLTYRCDNSRSGLNQAETLLAPANVNVARFGRLFSFEVDGAVYAQPLYVRGVPIPSEGNRDVVYVATQHDSVYAFDATGVRKAPFWKVNFTDAHNGVSTVRPDQVNNEDIVPEIGITGTPVIDPSTSTLYLVAKTSERGEYVQRLHALDLATGAEKFGGPAVIEAALPAEGGGAPVEFDPLAQNQRCALLLDRGVVYIAFASHGDVGVYHGWLLAYDASNLRRLIAFSTTPKGARGGIWMSGGGPAADENGNIFLSVGNGSFNANRGGSAYSNSFLRLVNSGGMLRVSDYFTPSDQKELDRQDLDLGSGGPLLLPEQRLGPSHLLITAGKDGTIYLVNRDNMGGLDGPRKRGNAVLVRGALGPFFGTPAYFNGMVYFAAEKDAMKAFVMQDGQLSRRPISQSRKKFGFRGASPVVSADGPSGAVVWAIDNRIDHAALRAFDARNVSLELYDSDQAGSRDRLDAPVKFTVPLVVDGKVYVGTQHHLTAFGLLPGQ